jgi:hypothetical protein
MLPPRSVTQPGEAPAIRTLSVVQQLFNNFTDRFGAANRFATSVLGVAQLPAQLLVMLEAAAVN